MPICRMSFFSRLFARTNHKSSSRPLPAGFCGLYNLGNTCYMNAVLQAIAHLPVFVSFCLQHPSVTSTSFAPGDIVQYNNHISAALIALVRAIQSGAFVVATPRAIKLLIGQTNELFAGNAQNDASEFLLFFLDALDADLRGTSVLAELPARPASPQNQELAFSDDEILRLVKNPTFFEQMGDPSMLVATRSPSSPQPQTGQALAGWIRPQSPFFAEHLRKVPSVITELFTGMFAKQTACPCGNLVVSHEPFTVIPITIPLPKEMTGNFPVVFVAADSIPERLYIRMSIQPTFRELADAITHLTGRRVRAIFPHTSSVLSPSFRSQQPRFDLRGVHQLVAYEDADGAVPLYCEVVDPAKHTTYRVAYPLLVTRDDIAGFLQLFGVTQQPQMTTRKGERHAVVRPGTFEDFQRLSQQLNDGNPPPSLLNPNEVSLDWCLEEFFGESVLGAGNEWLCEVCGRRVAATQRCTIEHFPPTLVIHFKRFKYTPSLKIVKDTQMVTFPTFLSFEPWGGSAAYTLAAVVNHKGTMHSGHYYSYCKMNDEWVWFNDESATVIRQDRVASPAAFLLFYERVA